MNSKSRLFSEITKSMLFKKHHSKSIFKHPYESSLSSKFLRFLSTSKKDLVQNYPTRIELTQDDLKTKTVFKPYEALHNCGGREYRFWKNNFFGTVC